MYIGQGKKEIDKIAVAQEDGVQEDKQNGM